MGLFAWVKTRLGSVPAETDIDNPWRQTVCEPDQLATTLHKLLGNAALAGIYPYVEGGQSRFLILTLDQRIVDEARFASSLERIKGWIDERERDDRENLDKI